jgi:hypothetical protein
MLSIPPILMRQLWFLVEGTQASLLLALEDESLIQRLTAQMQVMDTESRLAVDLYIQDKLPLIRDLARSRTEPSF